MTRSQSFSRAICEVRYWFYRRRIGNPFPLHIALSAAIRRYRFERVAKPDGGAK